MINSALAINTTKPVSCDTKLVLAVIKNEKKGSLFKKIIAALALLFLKVRFPLKTHPPFWRIPGPR